MTPWRTAASFWMPRLPQPASIAAASMRGRWRAAFTTPIICLGRAGEVACASRQLDPNSAQPQLQELQDALLRRPAVQRARRSTPAGVNWAAGVAPTSAISFAGSTFDSAWNFTFSTPWRRSICSTPIRCARLLTTEYSSRYETAAAAGRSGRRARPGSYRPARPRPPRRCACRRAAAGARRRCIPRGF